MRYEPLRPGYLDKGLSSLFAQCSFLWRHPDPDKRFAFRIGSLLALLSLSLGILSVCLSLAV